MRWMEFRVGKNNSVVDMKPYDNNETVLLKLVETPLYLVACEVPLSEKMAEVFPPAAAGLTGTVEALFKA